MEKLHITQKRQLESLLLNDKVDNYHKTLLKGIKGNNFKNVSVADKEVLRDLLRRYGVLR